MAAELLLQKRLLSPSQRDNPVAQTAHHSNAMMFSIKCIIFVSLLLLTCSTAAHGSVERRTPEWTRKGQNNNKKDQNIVGGTDVPPGRFPYYGHFPSAGINAGDFGATLIHSDILIASTDGGLPESCSVYLDSVTYVSGTVGTVEEVLIHPEFQFLNLYSPNLMVLKLSEPQNLATIPRNTDGNIPADGQQVTTMGFGETGTGPPLVLQQVTVDAGPQETCADILDFNGATTEEIAGLLCTTTNGAGPCFNDYGSPLLTAADGTGDVLGLVSFFEGSCFSGFSFYTDVTAFASWIDAAICCMSDSPPESCGDDPQSFCDADGLGEVLPVNCAPDNNERENAIPVAVGQQGVGSTENAPLSNLEACGVFDTRGIWFSIVGDGRVIRATTCSFLTGYNTYLSVITDESGDICIAENDDDPFCSFAGQSTVYWQSAVGTTYYIFVHGSESTDLGQFRLDVDNAAPLNDDCADAVFVPGSIDGNTIDATDDDVTTCGDVSPSDNLGVWYTVVGTTTGNIMIASTCSGLTDFDTQIVVFAGACDGLTCIDGNDNDESGSLPGCSSVSWETEEDVLYTIFVYGVESETGLLTLGISDIAPTASPTTAPTSQPTLEPTSVPTAPPTTPQPTPTQPTPQPTRPPTPPPTLPPTHAPTYPPTRSPTKRPTREPTVTPDAPENDVCESSLTLETGETLGTTLGATPDDVKICGDNNPGMGDSRGVWYDIEGDGDRWTVSTCSNDTTFDTQLTLYEGSCDDLKCLKGSDDNGDCSINQVTSIMEWDSEEDVQYYVYVHGFGDQTGDFVLLVESEETAPLTPAEAWVVGTLTLLQMGGALIGLIVGSVLFLC